MMEKHLTEKENPKAHANWLSAVQKSAWIALGAIHHQETERLGQQLIDGISFTATTGELPEFLRKTLREITEMAVANGLNPSDTALFVFSLRPYLEELLPHIDGNTLMTVLDQVGLFIFEVYLKAREEEILNQRQDLLELSTPVIRIWEGILAVPLIGTMDSKRAQQVMEKLLNSIVETNARVTILDITGVPTVDTLVANHILKTAAAVRLLGATLIITGISPVIAQTMVHMGVDLGPVITRSVMADGIALSLEMLQKRFGSEREAG
ncbi:STAS domain-containing protein [Heliobacterium gestii]|uniref:STAS domain-containing protein n=1 Tax=Heliomicrobium gestii TaxID=2699 RepID=A0A845LAY6_HELGE|nr:STAS domain-containing protein [Heliomicrobium gestii]MBM7865849.1 rsbT co-antagonist protein RsbR [Heliomicrobium gestii]MZP42090.1 STAS domain-containing protein [Heliomicrobium gestii]